MTRIKLMLCWMMVATGASHALAAPGHYPISTEQIAATMSRMGMLIAPGQVTLLTDVVATTSTPRLKVRSIEPWGNQRMMARLECESSDQCLPFFVGLRMNGGSSAQSSVSSAQSPSPAVTPAIAPKTFAVRSGSPATLMLEGERVHIRISVICLENGALGQTIRVATKDRKLVYHAQVIDGSLLQGRL